MLLLVRIASKNIHNSGLECKNHILLETKMVIIDALFLIKTVKTQTFWGRTYPYSPYKGVPPGRGAQRPKLEAEEASKEYARKELRASICKGRSVKKQRGEKRKREA